MTTDQFEQIMGAISKISRGEKFTWNNPLVGDGTSHPPAPTQFETASDPGKYFGTRYDPLDVVISSNAVVEIFQTIENAFVGGPVTLWYQRDPEAMKAWYLHKYKVPLNLSKLHPNQRTAMGIVG